MSGHSKWSKVKHQKATTDDIKGRTFTKASQAITLAVREGAGITDPAGNFRLRLAIEKAKAVNMPKDKIEKAIARAAGGEGGALSEHIYEGFGPAGIGVLIHVLTDNPNRTVSAVKNILERFGGTLAGPGAVAHLFKRSGLITILKNSLSADDVLNTAIEAGADDVEERDDTYIIHTDVHSFEGVKEFFEKKKMHTEQSQFGYVPIMTVPVPEEKAESLENILFELDGLDDVIAVYTNS